MKTHFDLDEILKIARIDNELDLERALIAERKLRVLAKENPELTEKRKRLRAIIANYENENWSLEVEKAIIVESDKAEIIAENERLFIENRKVLIKDQLKNLGLTQEQFGLILGHKSKTYISELINGIRPFSLKDLIVINRILDLELKLLIPTFLSDSEQQRIKSSLLQLKKKNLRLSKKDFGIL